jgi:hypothetical protein
MATDTEWLTAVATPYARPEIEKVEKAILGHFGTATRAREMIQLFPGRYLIATRNEDGIFGDIFGSTYEGRVLTDKYTLIDKLAPKEES